MGSVEHTLCPFSLMNHCFSIDWLILRRCFQQEIVGLGEDGNPKKKVQVFQIDICLHIPWLLVAKFTKVCPTQFHSKVRGCVMHNVHG
jgi:hypothetical protein